MRRRIVGAVRWRAEIASEWAFDCRRGIDTTGVVRLDGTNYQPVHPAAFREFLAHVEVRRSTTTFIDLGSGRGRALFLAVEHGFATAIGIEIEPLHHAIAAANLARYRRRRRRSRIRLLHGDARGVVFPSGALVVFMYNPFPREITKAVVDRLCTSLRRDPRPAWLIYEAPVDRDVIDAH
ncbi:MAG TPA: hypothetical protein VI300_07470, partial [Solirubrobacter sp.]